MRVHAIYSRCMWSFPRFASIDIGIAKWTLAVLVPVYIGELVVMGVRDSFVGDMLFWRALLVVYSIRSPSANASWIRRLHSSWRTRDWTTWGLRACLRLFNVIIASQAWLRCTSPCLFLTQLYSRLPYREHYLWASRVEKILLCWRWLYETALGTLCTFWCFWPGSIRWLTLNLVYRVIFVVNLINVFLLAVRA